MVHPAFYHMLDLSSILDKIADYSLKLGQSPVLIALWCKQIVKALKCPMNMGDKENIYNHKLCQLLKEDMKIHLGLQVVAPGSDSSDLEVLPPG